MFYKKGILRNFSKFTRKHLSLFFNKVAGLRLRFSCEFYEISKNTFFHRTRLVAASVKTWRTSSSSCRFRSAFFENTTKNIFDGNDLLEFNHRFGCTSFLQCNLVIFFGYFLSFFLLFGCLLVIVLFLFLFQQFLSVIVINW